MRSASASEPLAASPAEAYPPLPLVNLCPRQPFLAPAQPRPEQPLPLGATLQQVVDFRGNRDHVVLLQHDRAVRVQHVPPAVGKFGHYPPLERGHQPEHRAENAAPAEVEAQAFSQRAASLALLSYQSAASVLLMCPSAAHFSSVSFQ